MEHIPEPVKYVLGIIIFLIATYLLVKLYVAIGSIELSRQTLSNRKIIITIGFLSLIKESFENVKINSQFLQLFINIDGINNDNYFSIINGVLSFILFYSFIQFLYLLYNDIINTFDRIKSRNFMLKILAVPTAICRILF